MKTFLKNISLIAIGAILATTVTLYAATIEANINSFTQYIQELFVTSDGTPSGSQIARLSPHGMQIRTDLENNQDKQGRLDIGNIDMGGGMNISGVSLQYQDMGLENFASINIFDMSTLLEFLQGPSIFLNNVSNIGDITLLMNANVGAAFGYEVSGSNMLNEMRVLANGASLLHENTNTNEDRGINVGPTGISVFRDETPVYHLPIVDGTAGQVLTTDGNGYLYRSTP